MGGNAVDEMAELESRQVIHENSIALLNAAKAEHNNGKKAIAELKDEIEEVKSGIEDATKNIEAQEAVVDEQKSKRSDAQSELQKATANVVELKNEETAKAKE